MFPGHGKYVTTKEEFEFIPGALEAIRLFTASGFTVFIASNQAGVAKGLYTKEALDGITDKMLSGIREAGGKIEDVLYCLHQSEDDCDCRKPKPGLLSGVLNGMERRPRACFFIGDSSRDVRAAHQAGAVPVLVLSGQTKKSDIESWEDKPEFVFDDLSAAAKYICGKHT